MTAQHKALQLADLLETVGRLWEDEAAEELRRLHQSEKEAWRYADELEQERKRLTKAAEMALEVLECHLFKPEHPEHPLAEQALKELRQALAHLALDEMAAESQRLGLYDNDVNTKCKDHPDAPHSFDRNASLTEDRYVCECEYWEPPAQPEQEPVAHLWECIGRWTAMIANDGKDAELAPPDWLVNAIEAATTPPKREWVGLTHGEIEDIESAHKSGFRFARAIEAKLKEKNT